MRGKALFLSVLWVTSGITPAYAGKRRASQMSLRAERDHPRVCGEKAAVDLKSIFAQGSPPRMRGKAGPAAAPCPALRITPAYAGKRRRRQSTNCGRQDHPRVCGEKQKLNRMPTSAIGSPPRMRGKAKCASLFRFILGITPAYAGKRLKRSHRIGHFSCILCLFHSVLHRASASGGSRAGPCAPPCLPAQNAVPV